MLKQLYNSLIFEKGILLNSSLQTKSFILSNEDESILSDYNKLLGLRNDLKTIYEKPKDTRESPLKLEAEVEKLEKHLARMSAQYRSEQLLNSVSKELVLQNMKEDEACIEFTNINLLATTEGDSVIYAACILKANGCLLYTSPSPRDATLSRMPSSA